MITQKQWAIQHLAAHLKNISAGIAVEAAHSMVLRQPAANDFTAIAEETRMLANKMLKIAEKSIFGNLSDEDFNKFINDCAMNFYYLSTNAGLLSCKMREHQPIAVFADELRACASDLSTIAGAEQPYADVLTVLPRNKVMTGRIYLFKGVSGGYTWFENAQHVHEIFFNLSEYVQNKRLIIKNEWRDMDMPFIDLGKHDGDVVTVIVSDAFDSKKKYAVQACVPFNALSHSHAGVSKPCDAGIPIRDCWATSDGSDIIFPDWEKIASTL